MFVLFGLNLLAVLLLIVLAVWLWRMRTQEHCQHPDCKKHGIECRVYDWDAEQYTYERYCADHAYEHGYCYLCGEFWAGIESFDFGNPSHLCEICQDEVKADMGEYDDYDDDPDYFYGDDFNYDDPEEEYAAELEHDIERQVASDGDTEPEVM